MDRLRRLAFDLCFDREELLAPRFAAALRALVNRVADGKTVVALAAIIAGKSLALAATLKLPELRAAVLFIQHVFTGDAHVHSPEAQNHITNAVMMAQV
jgi:hypothetical protein